MNVEQLRDSVSALGFENGIHDERLFILSANRALRLIFTERSVVAEADIRVDFPSPTTLIGDYWHKGRERTVFKLSGYAYSFKASGHGSYTVTDRTGSVTREISGDGVIYRGFIDGEGEIAFFGDFRFSVYSLASFTSLISADARDIPLYSAEMTIDLPLRIPDFLSIASVPVMKGGGVTEGARVVGSTLCLPSHISGEVSILYRRSLRPIESDSTEKIDIPIECECLLPFLTASFMWLEDDSDMAQYYMALYRNTLATVRAEHNGLIDTEYKTDGWA